MSDLSDSFKGRILTKINEMQDQKAPIGLIISEIHSRKDQTENADEKIYLTNLSYAVARTHIMMSSLRFKSAATLRAIQRKAAK